MYIVSFNVLFIIFIAQKQCIFTTTALTFLIYQVKLQFGQFIYRKYAHAQISCVNDTHTHTLRKRKHKHENARFAADAIVVKIYYTRAHQHCQLHVHSLFVYMGNIITRVVHITYHLRSMCSVCFDQYFRK